MARGLLVDPQLFQLQQRLFLVTTEIFIPILTIFPPATKDSKNNSLHKKYAISPLAFSPSSPRALSLSSECLFGVRKKKEFHNTLIS